MKDSDDHYIYCPLKEIPMTTKVDYQIIVNDWFFDMEIDALKDKAKQYYIKEVSWFPKTNMIHVVMNPELDTKKALGYIATWMSHIGADGDIFCIRKVETFYTNYTSPEVKDLLRTKK